MLHYLLRRQNFKRIVIDVRRPFAGILGFYFHREIHIVPAGLVTGINIVVRLLFGIHCAPLICEAIKTPIYMYVFFLFHVVCTCTIKHLYQGVGLSHPILQFLSHISPVYTKFRLFNCTVNMCMENNESTSKSVLGLSKNFTLAHCRFKSSFIDFRNNCNGDETSGAGIITVPPPYSADFNGISLLGRNVSHLYPRNTVVAERGENSLCFST